MRVFSIKRSLGSKENISGISIWFFSNEPFFFFFIVCYSMFWFLILVNIHCIIINIHFYVIFQIVFLTSEVLDTLTRPWESSSIMGGVIASSKWPEQILFFKLISLLRISNLKFMGKIAQDFYFSQGDP